jgi:hypothetical protein
LISLLFLLLRLQRWVLLHFLVRMVWMARFPLQLVIQVLLLRRRWQVLQQEWQREQQQRVNALLLAQKQQQLIQVLLRQD